MESTQFTAIVTDFFHTYPLLGFAALAIAAFLVYKSPKESFKVLVIFVILAIAAYFVLQITRSTDTGMSEKKEMIDKTRKALDE